MPTYEYRCPNGHDFERFYRTISGAPAVVECPECGLVAERRMSAGAGLLFKGSGFYITDYGKDGKKDQRTAAKADAGKPEKADGAAAAGGGGGEPKGDGASKPAAPAGGSGSSTTGGGGTSGSTGGSTGSTGGGTAE
jgi:putative FmdB family regulatory protein